MYTKLILGLLLAVALSALAGIYHLLQTRLRRMGRERNILMALIEHQLCDQLTGLKWEIAALEDSPLSPAQKDYLHQARESVSDALSLHGTFTILSRPPRENMHASDLRLLNEREQHDVLPQIFHQTRGILTSIKWNVEMFADDHSSALQEHCRRIHEGIQRAIALLDQSLRAGRS